MGFVSDALFADMANPTEAEVRAWARADTVEPMQDWDLILASAEFGELLLDLVGDQTLSPVVHQYFLSCLYTLIGDAVRSSFGVTDRAAIDELVASARRLGQPATTRWADRGSYLISHPETFDYHQWCDGVLARTP